MTKYSREFDMNNKHFKTFPLFINKAIPTIYSRIFVVLSLSLFLFCSGPKDKQPKVLARIGDRVITVDEFLQRSELTPRPFYCRGNTEKDKIIALNSLIAEKLFALEDGEESEMLARPTFLAYLKGRKEQYMREELYKKIAVQPVRLDSIEVRKTLQLAGLVYDVNFYTIKKNEIAKGLQEKLLNAPDSAAKIFDAIDVGRPAPVKTIKFKDPEHPAIHQALYSKKLDAGTVVGPLKVAENDYLIFKVKRVSYSPGLSETEMLDRKRFVKERLTERESNEGWNQFTAKILKDKDIHFVPQTTIKLAQLYAESKKPDSRQKNIEINELGEQQVYLDFSSLADSDALLKAPFFKIGDKVWTVAEFRELLLSHPLVFRMPQITPDAYLEQFKLAVVDLIRDFYITQEAYKRSIDASETVKRNVEVWQDSYVALFHREKYLKALAQSKDFDAKRMRGVYTYIDEYADSLQKKYSPVIEINYDELEKTELTKTDLFSIRQFAPYPLVVPAFPQLCIDEKLDYGRIIK